MQTPATPVRPLRPRAMAFFAALLIGGSFPVAQAQTQSPPRKAPAPPVAAQAPTAQAPALPEAGVWIDDTGQGAVEVAPCGGNKLCGRIVWLAAPLDAKGKPIIDDLNPSPAKRKQPVCGLQILGGLEPQKDGTWDRGWVYDPKVGESYDLALRMKDANHLVITGYKGLKIFSESFMWTRAPADRQLAYCVKS